jgi:hypothetical protein
MWRSIMCSFSNNCVFPSWIVYIENRVVRCLCPVTLCTVYWILQFLYGTTCAPPSITIVAHSLTSTGANNPFSWPTTCGVLSEWHVMWRWVSVHLHIWIQQKNWICREWQVSCMCGNHPLETIHSTCLISSFIQDDSMLLRFMSTRFFYMFHIVLPFYLIVSV